MPLDSLSNAFQHLYKRGAGARAKLMDKASEVLSRTWFLGLTCFGGPPVHFQIFHDDFVTEKPLRAAWIDEQMYQELFALCQGLPGPASTKFLFVTVLTRFGMPCAIMAFFLWCLPGALGMFGLSLGIQQVSETLPDPVYALLSGLNASTVGIIAVAGVHLSESCIKDNISRILVILSACAGLCYSALWYTPTLVVAGGLVTLVWDLWLGRTLRRWRQRWSAKRSRQRGADAPTAADNEAAHDLAVVERNGMIVQGSESEPTIPGTSRRGSHVIISAKRRPGKSGTEPQSATVTPEANISTTSQNQQNDGERSYSYKMSTWTACIVMACFITSLVATVVIRSKLKSEYRPLSLFANMYLAGTIIFGGGPVVIPLLREYIVVPGWVTSRDFLIGLAIIQAFPGPIFNFSVYLGALTLAATVESNKLTYSLLGAILGFVGIFLPGLIFAMCIQAFWTKLRTRPVFSALLRGVNASAVGLIFTAVYRLWEVGYLSRNDAGGGQGQSLAKEPWWVVVAVLTYSGNKWFQIPAAGGILMGGFLGVMWWAATQRR